MLREIDTIRLKRVYELLVEMTEGRFGDQIERSSDDDDIELIIVLLNMMSEEMQETLSYYSVLHTPESTGDYVRKAIVLDQDHRVITMNKTARATLLAGDLPKEGSFFTHFLSDNSLGLWKVVTEKIKLEDDFEGLHTLEIKKHNGLTQKVHCSILTLVSPDTGEKFILITSFESKRSSILIEEGMRLNLEQDHAGPKVYNKHHVLKNYEDIQKLQKVYIFIREHLGETIPPIKELALQFGLNENKLKYGFKQMYHTTINRFITAERIRKAALLIQFTDGDLKTICHSCGFKSFSHFSRVFKQRYQYSPNKLYREHKNKSDQ